MTKPPKKFSERALLFQVLVIALGLIVGYWLGELTSSNKQQEYEAYGQGVAVDGRPGQSNRCGAGGSGGRAAVHGRGLAIGGDGGSMHTSNKDCR